MKKKLTELSLHKLKHLLNKKRARPLKKADREEIKEAINYVESENRKFVDNFFNSYIYKLATVQLRREGRAKKVVFGNGCHVYDYNIGDIFETMERIVSAINKQESRDGDKIEKL